MLKEFYQLLFIILFINFSSSQERIYFIGHAYGSPFVKDKKMEPSVLSFLKDDYTKVIYGGDFIYDPDDELEIENFLEFNKKRNYVLIPGNHDVKRKSFKHQKNRFEVLGNNLFIYLNTNFNDLIEVQNTADFVKKTIVKNNFKNILIFSHQLFYSKSNFDVRTNSRDNYQLANLFFDDIFDILIKINKNVYIYSGDIGAFKYTPYCFFNQIKNISFYSSGLGNSINNYCIEIKIDQKNNISNLFIDLNTSKSEKPEKFSLWKVRLYQFPKLILNKLKLYCHFFLIAVILFLGLAFYFRKKLLPKNFY